MATPHNSSAALAESFASILQFEKLEIHTVSLRFSNFNLSQNLSAIAFASLCGVALKTHPNDSLPHGVRDRTAWESAYLYQKLVKVRNQRIVTT